MAITAILVIDVGGDDLELEVQTSSFARQYRRTGTKVTEALGGTTLVTRVAADRVSFPPFTSGPLTTEQLIALKAAAQWPKTIVVGGTALRITTPDTVPQTINAKVKIESDDYLAVNGTDFLHIAHITVDQAD